MKEIFFLKILDLFSFFFKNVDGDYQNIRLILKLKFNLDRRKTPLMMRNIKTKPGKDRNMFIYSVFFYLFMGLLMLSFIAVLSHKSMFMGAITFFTILIVFVSYAIILEFSLDFFDVSDHAILLAKPFTHQELSVAKSIHIFIYMLSIALAFSVPTMVYWGIKAGWLISLVTFIQVFIILMLLFFVCAIFYSFLLSKFSGEKLKDILSFVQIISVIAVVIGYQIFLQTSIIWLEEMDVNDLPNLIYLLPPVWYALPLQMIVTKMASLSHILIALGGIAISILGFRFYLIKVSPFFERNLYKLKQVDTSSPKKKHHYSLKFTPLITDYFTRVFYKFSALMLTRERKLKQAIYPMLAMGLIFPLIMIYRMKVDSTQPLYESKSYFFIYYNLLMMIPLGIYTNYSEFYKAAWIYNFLPIKKPGALIKGAKLAMFFSYQFMILLFSGLIFLVMWRFTIIPDIIVVMINGVIVQMLYQNMTKHFLPFSQELKTGQNTAFKQGIYFLTVFVIAPLFAGIHFAIAYFFPNLMWFYIIILLGIAYLFYRNHFNIGWEDVAG